MPPIINILFAVAICLSSFVSVLVPLIWIRISVQPWGYSPVVVASLGLAVIVGIFTGRLLTLRLLAKIRQPFFIFGGLTLFISLYGFTAYPLFENLSWLSPSGTPLVIGLCVFSGLILPTILISAWVLVLKIAVSEDRTIFNAPGLGGVMALLGALVGLFMGGLWLIPQFGLNKANTAAVCLGLLSGWLILRLIPRSRR